MNDCLDIYLVKAPRHAPPICASQAPGRRHTQGVVTSVVFRGLATVPSSKVQASQNMCVRCSCSASVIPRHWLADVLSSLMQLERFWVTCLRCPESGGRTTSSTRASPSTRTSCSATTCRPRPHLEDIRPLQRSSSWPRGSTRCSQLLAQACRLEQRSAVI